MLKYVNTSIVFQEVPDEVTLAINISNCPCCCPGCHSKFLWGDVGQELTSEAIEQMMADIRRDITCVCFMGGDADPLEVNRLARTLRRRHPHCKVGWYSGRIRVAPEVDKADFDYIKIGPYLAHLGGLNKTTTNQRLYKRLPDGSFEDITARFWKK